jgi:hypothetical protein
MIKDWQVRSLLKDEISPPRVNARSFLRVVGSYLCEENAKVRVTAL